MLGGAAARLLFGGGGKQPVGGAGRHGRGEGGRHSIAAETPEHPVCWVARPGPARPGPARAGRIGRCGGHARGGAGSWDLWPCVTPSGIVRHAPPLGGRGLGCGSSVALEWKPVSRGWEWESRALPVTISAMILHLLVHVHMPEDVSFYNQRKDARGAPAPPRACRRCVRASPRAAARGPSAAGWRAWASRRVPRAVWRRSRLQGGAPAVEEALPP
jgi:hypothetical protein